MTVGDLLHFFYSSVKILSYQLSQNLKKAISQRVPPWNSASLPSTIFNLCLSVASKLWVPQLPLRIALASWLTFVNPDGHPGHPNIGVNYTGYHINLYCLIEAKEKRRKIFIERHQFEETQVVSTNWVPVIKLKAISRSIND